MEISSAVGAVGSEPDPKDPELNDFNLDLWEVVNALRRKGFTRLTNRFGVSMELEEACDMVLPILQAAKKSSESGEEETRELDLDVESNYAQMKRKLVEQNSIIEALKEENRVLGLRVGSLEAAVKDAMRRESAASDQMAIERKAKEELRAMHQVKDLELLRKIKRFNTSLEVDLMPRGYRNHSPSDGSLESLTSSRHSLSPRGPAPENVTPVLGPSSLVADRMKGRTDLNDRRSGTVQTRKTNKDRAPKTAARISCENVEREFRSGSSREDVENRSRDGFRNSSEKARNLCRNGARNAVTGFQKSSANIENLSRKGYCNAENALRRGSEDTENLSRNGSCNAENAILYGSENAEEMIHAVFCNPDHLAPNDSEDARSLSRDGFHLADIGSRSSSKNTESLSQRNFSETVDNGFQNQLRDDGDEKGSRCVLKNDVLLSGTEVELAEAHSSLQLLPLNECSSEFNLEEELTRTVHAKVKDCSTMAKNCPARVRKYPAKVRDCPDKVNNLSNKVTADEQRKRSSKGTCKPTKVTYSPRKVTYCRTKVKYSSIIIEKNTSKMKVKPRFESYVASSSTGVRLLDKPSLRKSDVRKEETQRVGIPDITQEQSTRTRKEKLDDVRSVVANRQITSCSLSPMVGNSFKTTHLPKKKPHCDATPSMVTCVFEETPSSQTTPSAQATDNSRATPSSQATPSFRITPISKITYLGEVRSLAVTPYTSETMPSTDTLCISTPSSDYQPSCETTPSRGNVNSSDISDTSLTEGNSPAGQALGCQGGVAPGGAGKCVQISKKAEVIDKTLASNPRKAPRPGNTRSLTTTTLGTPKSVRSPKKGTPHLYARLPKSDIRWTDRSGGTDPVQRTPKRPKSPAKPFRKVSASPSRSYTKQKPKDGTSPLKKNAEGFPAADASNRSDDTIPPRPSEYDDASEDLDVPASIADPNSFTEVLCLGSGKQPSEVNTPEPVLLSPRSKRVLFQSSTNESHAKQTQLVLRKDGPVSPRMAKNSVEEQRPEPTKNCAKSRAYT